MNSNYKVPKQYSAVENSVTTLIMIHSITQLSHKCFTASDVRDQFKTTITEHNAFQYSPLTPWRARSEAYIFVMLLAKIYRVDLINDANAISLSNLPTNQDFWLASASKIVTKSTLSVLKYSFMCENIKVDDILEYKANAALGISDSDGCIKRATIIGICLGLNKVSKSILLNNGDKLFNLLHLLQQVPTKEIYAGQPLRNPICDWFEILKFYINPT